jgi:MFS family permease
MFVVLLGSTVPTPLYDLYRTQWQVSAFVITVVFACYVAGVLTALILAGHLSDHIGRRPVSVAGVGFALLAAGLFATASGVAAVGSARFLSGIAVGLCTGALTAALRENQSRPGQGPLAASAITSAGLAFGPLLGGLAAQFAPMPLHTVFIVHLLLLVPAFAATWFLPESRPPRPRTRVPWRPRVGVPASARRAFLRPALAIGCAYAVNGLYSALAPTLAREYLGSSDAVAGLMVVIMLGVSAIAQIMLRSRPSLTSQRDGLVVLALGLLMLLPSLGYESTFGFLVAAAVTGV